MNITALVKVLILTTVIFPAWRLNKFLIFLKQNILFPECSKKDHQTFISDILTLFEYISRIKIKNKFENEENLDLFSIFSLGLILYRMEQLFLCRFKRHFLTTYSPAGTEPVSVKSGKLMSCVNKTLSKGLLVH